MHVGVQRSTSESGRRITLDGAELCARGRVCVCFDVCVSLYVSVCVKYREKTNLRREMGIHEEIVRALRWAGAG